MVQKLLNTYDAMHPIEKAAIICTALFMAMFNASMVWMAITAMAEGLI